MTRNGHGRKPKDSCVGVLFRGLLILTVVVVALVGWLS